MPKLIGDKKVNVAVFISGTGSNLKSIIKFSKTKKSPISVDLIISNHAKSKGLNFAKIYKIKKKVFDLKKDISSEKKLLLELKKIELTLSVLLVL